MTEGRSPALDAILATLADGKWVEGQTLLREGMRVVPPGLASRHYRAQGEGGTDRTLDERVASGRRAIAREALRGGIERGRFVVDVPALTRNHWRGELGWKVRDTEVGMLSIAQMADMLDISQTTARVWIKNGYVPEPTENAAGTARITMDQVPAWKLVREAYPGHQKQWMVNPRSLWAAPTDQQCPHCGEPLSITVTKAMG